MAIEVTVQIDKLVTVVVDTDAPYSPDTAEDLLRRTREQAVLAFLELPDDETADAEDTAE